MCLQVTDSQQALGDAELSKLKSSISAFFAKDQSLLDSQPIVPVHSEGPSVEASAPAAAAVAPAKAAAPKKGKAGSDPAVPLLSTVPGQQQELEKWSSMLHTETGLILQDVECAEWLHSLLKHHCKAQ